MVQILLVNQAGELVGIRVLGSLGFLVPDERELLGGVVIVVLALGQDILLDALHLRHEVVDRAETLDLLHLVPLAASRQGVAQNLVLPLAQTG